MKVGRVIGFGLLVGAIAVGSYFALDSHKKHAGYGPTLTPPAVVNTLETAASSESIDDLLAYTKELVDSNPKRFKQYITDITKIGIGNGYDDELLALFPADALERQVATLSPEAKDRMLRPLLEDKATEVVGYVRDFVDGQSQSLMKLTDTELYKAVEKKLVDLLEPRGN